jgi:hypothetical protein
VKRSIKSCSSLLGFDRKQINPSNLVIKVSGRVRYGREKNDKNLAAKRIAVWGFLAFGFTALAQQPSTQSVMKQQVGIVEQRFVPAAGAMPGDLIRIPSGLPITVDGKASVNEWDNSKFVELPVARNWTVRVRFKHDAKNLYFAFEGVKRGTEQLFPEILIAPKPEIGRVGTRRMLASLSYNLCEGLARRTCTRRMECSSAVPSSRDGRVIIPRGLTQTWWR